MNQGEFFSKEIGRIDEECKSRLHEQISCSNNQCIKRIKVLGFVHVLIVFLVLIGAILTVYALDRKGFYAVCIIAVLIDVLTVFNLVRCFKKVMAGTHEKEGIIYESAIKEIADVANNERKKDFLKNGYIEELSYDIEIPLDAMMGLNEKVFRDSTEFKVIENSAKLNGVMKVLKAYINDLCIASRFGMDKLEIKKESYDLGILICDIENLGLKAADEKGIKLQFDINNDIPAILMGDPMHIELIILKLLANALKYTDEGVVTLSVGYVDVSEKEIILNISVKDTGRGIKEEDMERFFSKTKSPEEALVEGGSLAMCMTKTLLEKMDSELRAESKLTQGSEFRFMVKQDVVERIPLGKREDAIRRLHTKDLKERNLAEADVSYTPSGLEPEPVFKEAPEPVKEVETPVPAKSAPEPEKPAKEEVQSKDDFIKKLSSFDELFVDEGIRNAGSEELYKKVISDFCDSASGKADDIEMHLEKEDIRNYTIEVHALKSAARIIGYKKLSKLAEALEEAGNENDLVRINNATGELIRLYRDIAGKIETARGDNDSKDMIDEASLKDAITSIKEFAEVFDFDSIDFVMNELKKYSMPEDFKDKYSKLKTAVAGVARDDIIAILKD